MLNVQIFQSGRVPAKSTDYFTIEGLEYQLRHFVGSSNKSAVRCMSDQVPDSSAVNIYIAPDTLLLLKWKKNIEMFLNFIVNYCAICQSLTMQFVISM